MTGFGECGVHGRDEVGLGGVGQAGGRVGFEVRSRRLKGVGPGRGRRKQERLTAFVIAAFEEA